jgi:hypothetical protein
MIRPKYPPLEIRPTEDVLFECVRDGFVQRVFRTEEAARRWVEAVAVARSSADPARALQRAVEITYRSSLYVNGGARLRASVPAVREPKGARKRLYAKA